MKFLPYVLKHLRRSWLRTLSTVLGMALCIFLICTLQTALEGMNQAVAGANPGRIVTRHAVSLVFNMPYSYRQRIASVPGVKLVSQTCFFGGLPGGGGSQDFANFFANFAIEAEPYFAMFPEYILTPEVMQAFMSDRRGAIIGRALSRKFGWNMGDTFTLESFIPPYRVGKPFEFVVRGIFDADLARFPGTNEQQMFFHFAYLDEATRHRAGIGTFMIQVTDPSRAGQVAKAIDDTFENTDVQTKTANEAVFRESFTELAGNLVLLLNGIGLAVGFTVLLVTANTMSMAVRERRTEIAVLKTLGFPSRLVMGLILTEAVVLSALAGVLGIWLSGTLVANIADIPFLGAALSQFPPLALSRTLALTMFGVSCVMGLAAGLIPSWTAYRAGIVDTLRAA